MRRRLLALALLLAGCTPAGRPAPLGPNVLILLTEDHRFDALRTPAFARLASEGARMDACYAAGPLSCPSRAAYLSGLYPRQSGILVNGGGRDLPEGTPTVASLLEKAGYVTGFIGKAHLGGDPKRWGFRECPMVLPGDRPQPTGTRVLADGKPLRLEAPASQAFADAALDWMTRHRAERWLLWVAFSAPRAPGPSPDLDGYSATVSLFDGQVGRVLDQLRELGLEADTLVILLSDNGPRKGKGLWSEASARVPALARWPGRIPAGATVPTPLSGVDLLPTLCEAAGIRTPEDCLGLSMLPALTGKTPLRKTVFAGVGSSSRDRWEMVRSQRHKYVLRGNGEELLYDLEVDPGETRNLAGEGSSAPLLEEIRGLLNRSLKEDPL